MSMFERLPLPNGSVIANRIAKAAMEENMADADQAPSEHLMRLYQSWADGEAGLILTGNVMVDGRAVTGPGGVVLEDDRHLDKFKRWASIGRSKGAQFWLQIQSSGPPDAGQSRAGNLGAFGGATGFGKAVQAFRRASHDDSGFDRGSG